MCSSWTAHTFGGNVELLQESQGCIRSIVVLGRARTRHYSRIPWLLARLEESGIAAECTRQFNAVPEASHESVSKEFMAAGSRLRPMVDNIAPDEQVCARSSARRFSRCATYRLMTATLKGLMLRCGELCLLLALPNGRDAPRRFDWTRTCKMSIDCAAH